MGKKPSPSQEIRSFRTGIPGMSPGSEQDPADCALVPYARQVFAGYRFLQEYFAFHERFFFVDIEGLDAFAATQEESPFEIKIVFDRKLPAECKPTSKDILLHCTPIVNLFKRATEEVIVDQRLPEYYILPNGDRRKSWEIYSVNKVIGVSEDKQQLYKYLPVTSYDILDTSDPEYDYKRFYSISLRASKSDMSDAFIRIFGPSMELDDFPKETLSIGEATISNGFLPAKYLDVGEISESVSFPEGMTVSNITAPSEILNCPERQNFLWALISHLNLSFTSLAELETLKSVLSLYNWNEDINNPNKKKIQAITRIHPPTPKHVVQDKGLIRGIEFKIEVDENQFENGEGDIHLFGTVLSRFLSQYVTINSFVILTIVETETKKQHTWTPKLGKISPV
jgi:type VI secretion system protein ImpG